MRECEIECACGNVSDSEWVSDNVRVGVGEGGSESMGESENVRVNVHVCVFKVK